MTCSPLSLHRSSPSFKIPFLPSPFALHTRAPRVSRDDLSLLSLQTIIMLELHPNSSNVRPERGPKIGHSGNSSPSSSSVSSGILFAPTCRQHDDPPSPPSPPLWSNTSHPLLPTSARSQAIARGRGELMEMLKDVPESAYELSLKDLVERVGVKEKEEPKEEVGQNRGLNNKKNKRQKGNGGGWEQNYGNGGGLLLKMFVPSSYLASKPANGSGRVSPRPLFTVEGKECGAGSGGDNWEWWRKGFMAVGFGRNGRSSSSGSSNSNRSGRRSSSRYSDGLSTGCWSFLRPSRRKSYRD